MKQLQLAKQAAESRLVQELQSLSVHRDSQRLGTICSTEELLVFNTNIL